MLLNMTDVRLWKYFVQFIVMGNRYPVKATVCGNIAMKCYVEKFYEDIDEHVERIYCDLVRRT